MTMTQPFALTTPDDDQRLLEAFIESRSNEAFRALVNRYSSFVYSIALRELGRRDLAEDAVQGVFLVLVRKAPKVAFLPGWLFNVTRGVARDIRRKEVRRAARERKAFEASEKTDAWAQVEPLLNDALAALNERDRWFVIQRFFEERSFKDLGRMSAMTEDAARMRLNRALDRMRRRLQRAGVVLSAAALGLLLEERWAVACPLAPSAIRLSAPKAVRPVWPYLAAAGLGTAGLWFGVAPHFTSGVAVAKAPVIEEDVVKQATQESKAALAQIHNYYAEVRLTARSGQYSTVRNVRYWRDESGYRASEKSRLNEDQIVDLEVKGDRQLVMTTIPGRVAGPEEGRVIVAAKDRRTIESDAWEVSLLTMPVLIHAKKPWPIFTRTEALEMGKVTKSEWLTKNGVKYAHLVLSLGEERTYDILMDPTHSWAIAECNYRYKLKGSDGQDISHETTYRVESWKEAAPSIFLPQKVAIKGSLEDTTVEFLDLKVNKGVPDRLPMPKYIYGALVMDEVRRVFYRVDQNGKRITEEKAIWRDFDGG